MCEYLRQARQTTLGESGVAKPAECNLEGGSEAVYNIHIIYMSIYAYAAACELLTVKRLESS